MKIINRIKQLLSNIKDSIKKSIHNYYVLYADSTELLEKAQKLVRPLPEGCEIIKLTHENKGQYKCTVSDVDKMLLVKGDVWAVVNKDNKVLAFQFGTYRGKKSLFFNVKKCDYEHVEIKTDGRFRRQGLALNLLYHAVKNLNFEDVNHKKLGTVVKPSNIPSLKLHELIGFKISHRVFFWGIRRKKKDGRWVFINIPRYSI